MTPQFFAALAAFVAVTSWTPGPNNLMLVASGVNFGFSRTVPHMLGIAIGFPLMIVIIGLGMGQLFAAFPQLYDILKWLSVVYMIWLAWKIATAGPLNKETAAAAQPMRFHEAVLFQWVNPKAWAMALAGIASHTIPSAFATSLTLLAVTFGIITFPGVAVWTSFGVGLRRLLQDPARVQIFNIAMAVLLLASLYPVLAGWE